MRMGFSTASLRIAIWALLLSLGAGALYGKTDDPALLIRRLLSDDEGVQNTAFIEFKKLDSRGREAVIDGLIKNIDGETPSGRDGLGRESTTAQVLGRIGPEAKRAIPQLYELLEDYPVYAGEALERMGLDAMPYLEKALLSTKWPVKTAAAVGLRAMGPRAVPVLLQAVDERKALMNYDPPAAALAKMGKDAAADVIRSLEAGDRPRAMLWVLGRMETTDEALPPLISRLDAGEDDVRRLAAESLRNHGPHAKSAAPALLAHFGERNPSVKTDIVCAFAATEAAPPGAAEALLKILAADDYSASACAARALAEIGAPDEKVIRALKGMLDLEYAGAEAAYALVILTDGKDQEAVKALVGSLAEPESRAPHFEKALSKMGSSGMSLLRTALKEKKVFDRGALKETLGRIGTPEAKAIADTIKH